MDMMHGYSMGELQEIARASVIINRQTLATYNYAEAIEWAWEGVVLALCEADERPERNDLMYAGYAAARAEIRQQNKARGWGSENDTRATTGRNFERYWALTSTTDSPESAVVDQLAFRQIWDRLNWRDRQTFTASALSDYDDQRAADMLGVTKHAFQTRMNRARTNFLYWWHQGETPSRVWKRSMPEGYKANAAREGGRFVAA